MLSTYVSYQLIAKDIPKAIDRIGNEPVVERETEYYRANIGSIKTVDEFIKNDRLFKYAMKAFGLGDMDYAKAFMAKAMNEGIRDDESFANKLTDKRYADFVSTFNFEALGDLATSMPTVQQPVVDKYLRQTLEEDAGQTNEGVRLALYFERKAPDLTNWYEVLADKALATVIRTAFGLPESFASADIDKQVKLFESKMDIADFADPEKLAQFMTRFTSLYELQNPTSTAQTSVSVLFSQPTTVGVSTDLLLAMQQLRY